jgi:predicted RNA binding protein YcfA (HicA-like mRNA interferase family)
MKLPRNESGDSLIKKLAKHGYKVTRQKGSHIRITRSDENGSHHLTIPDHNPIKPGLLSRILSDVAFHLGMEKEALITFLYDERSEK